MSLDRELLELAAKAAGIEINWFKWERLTGQWNPLVDDGDALRLAAKCEIDIEFDYIDYPKVTAWYCLDYDKHDGLWSKVDEPVGDRCAATRRAITRAAAEIGKSLTAKGETL
jgi:hypothetical protein